jgi:hypothetical protein
MVRDKDAKSGRFFVTPTADGLRDALANASTTSRALDWGAIRRLALESGNALADDDRCALLVRVANGDRVTAAQWNSLLGADALLMNGTIALADSVASDLRDALSDIVSGSRSELAKLRRACADIASNRALVVPAWSASGSRIDRYVFHDMKGALAYALLLFLDPKLPYFDALGRCKYEPCHRFYLRDRKPGQPPKFCCAEHSEQHDRDSAAARMAKMRKSRR